MKQTKLDRYLLAAMGCTHIVSPKTQTPKPKEVKKNK